VLAKVVKHSPTPSEDLLFYLFREQNFSYKTKKQKHNFVKIIEDFFLVSIYSERGPGGFSVSRGKIPVRGSGYDLRGKVK